MLKRFFDQLQVAAQLPLPQQLLTRCFGRLANSEIYWVKTVLIRSFIWIYKIDMTEATIVNSNGYASFNAFFTRELKPNTRPMPTQTTDWISPCDGSVSATGIITSNHLIQAKHINYPLHHLLDCTIEQTEAFKRGSFATIYLSPQNYHRVHMPCTGHLTACRYVPGRLFSVSPATTRALPGLFCRNERVINCFNDQYGQPFILVLVGAMIVGGIETVWHGRFQHQNTRSTLSVPTPPIRLQQGQELGRFLLGSTVIMISSTSILSSNIAAGESIRLHQPL